MGACFITVEGQDGAGKSTNLQAICDTLDELSIRYVTTREPGGTLFGESIRELILSSDDAHFGSVAELLLVFAARAQHLEEVIRPNLEAGVWVISDRFTDATYAYQGGGRGIDLDKISALEQFVQDDFRPDLTLLFDVPVEEGERRAGNRSEPDRFEAQQQLFKQKVRACYLQRADDEPRRIKVIDASQSIDQVMNSTKQAVKEFVETRNG